MLDVKARPLKRAQLKARLQSRAGNAANSIYAAHSVLASGKWAKIRVSETGVHQLTTDVVRRAGFTDINKVKIYGYGGNLQNEALYANDIKETDDLKEVEQCVVDGKHYFYARGPVSWKNDLRVRNPYSDYGYYFITQTDEAPTLIDSAAFVQAHYPQSEHYHSLYEVDGYSWFPGGRNLFNPTAVKVGESQNVVITNKTGNPGGKVTVAVSSGINSTVSILRNGTALETLTLKLPINSSGGSYSKGVVKSLCLYLFRYKGERYDFHQAADGRSCALGLCFR